MSAEPFRRDGVVLAVVVVVAAALRIGLAVQPGLWCDEIFSLAMATGHSLEHPAAAADAARGDFVEPAGVVPAAEFRRYLEHETPPAGFARVMRAVALSDTSPPLYYLLLDLWQRVTGSTDAALRLFSVACALAALPLLWRVAAEIGGARVALLASLLFTVAPPALYYSVEGRMYALTWVFGLGLADATLALAGSRTGAGARAGARAGWVVAWIACASAGLLTHYFFAFVWLAIAAWLLLYPGRAGRGTVAVMIVTVGMLILPWYRQVPASLAAWRVTGHWLDTRLDGGQLAYGVLRLAGGLVNGVGVWGGRNLTMVAQAALFAALVAANLRRGRARTPSRAAGLVVVWLAASAIGPVVLDLLRHTATSRVERYALPGLPAALLLFALALDRVFRPAGAVVLIGTLIAWLPGLRDVARSSPRAWEPFPVIAAQLEGWTRPDDLVIVSSIPSGVLAVARYLDPATPMAAWVEALHRRRMPEAAERLTADRCRVAFVRTHDLGDTAPVEGWLRAHAETVRDLGLAKEIGGEPAITVFTLRGRDGRCASRSSDRRAPASSDPDTRAPRALRSAG